MTSTSINITDYRKQLPGSLSEDMLTYSFPQINSVNTATNNATMWKVIVRLINTNSTDENLHFIPIANEYFDNKPMPPHIYGWINVISKVEGGKIRDTTPTIVRTGKNIGRKNATNVFCQSLRDAYGLHNKQVRKTSEHAPTTTVQLLPPMLAQFLSKQKNTHYEHTFLQRKFNGVRVVSVLDENNIIMYSRGRKIYSGFDYIKVEIMPILFEERKTNNRTVYLDGELYKNGISLQTISGVARSGDSEIKLEYHIYDCFIPTEPNLVYEERKQILEKILPVDLQYIKRVETFSINNENEIQQLYKQFLAEGYEGAILRINDVYKYSFNNYHSKSLLKIKPLMDENYKLVGYTEGTKGKALGALMLIFETNTGKQFTVTPKGEIEERKRLFKQMGERVDDSLLTYFDVYYKGKMMNVEFAELSSDGVPQQPRVNMVVRDYE